MAKQDIATRIRRVCETLRDDEFEALVARMAEIDVRYRLREEWMRLESVYRGTHALN